MAIVIAKAGKCCCTPEPYKHLFYLALYLERVFPQNLRDGTNAKEVFSFDDLPAWVTLPSVVLWQHIHTKYIQVPEYIGSEAILYASPNDLRAYREFLLPPRTQNHPVFEVDNALRWVDPGHFWAFKTYGTQGFDTSGRCSYCEFYHAFKRLEKLEKKEMRRESRARRPGFFKRILSNVGTPARTPSPKPQEVGVAC